jgi:TonB family protein
MIWRSANRQKATRGGLIASATLHAILLLVLCFQVGAQNHVSRGTGGLTEITYLEAHYGQDVAAKVRLKALARVMSPESGRGISTDSVLKPRTPQPEPPRGEVKPAVAEPKSPDLAGARAPDQPAPPPKLVARTLRPITATIVADGRGPDPAVATVQDAPAPRVAAAGSGSDLPVQPSHLQARSGRVLIVDEAAAVAGTKIGAAAAGQGTPQLAGGALEPRPFLSQPPTGPVVRGSGAIRGGGPAGVQDVPGPAGAGASESSSRKTILDYGRGGTAGGSGGGTSPGGGGPGRRARLVEALEGRAITGESENRRAEGQGQVAEADLGGQGISMTISGQIKGRGIIKSVAPDYPEKARRQGWDGIVAVHFTVLADGRVKDNIYFEQTSVHRELNQAATAALKQFQFAPLPADQAAVEQWGVITIVFRLN